MKDNLNNAITRLRDAKLVALPTETVYGLAADACCDDAVKAIYGLKGRPSNNPLIIHVNGLDMAARYVEISPLAEALAEAFWPGPLTLVLNKVKDCPISPLASGGGDTLAVRMPNHPIAQEVITTFDGGLAAPSANRSGKISPTSPAHVRNEFPNAGLLILDGGATTIGIESTVVDARNDAPVILRPGSVTEENIALTLPLQPTGFRDEGTKDWPAGQNTTTHSDSRFPIPDSLPLSPGLLSAHYAPSIPVRLNATDVQPSEALLAFGPDVSQGAKTVLNLSESANLEDAAANLYDYLRQLDTPDHSAIVVMPIPHTGIGIAINDRLMRAATG